MKKMFSLLISMFCILIILAACDISSEHPKIDLSGTTKIEVLHYVGGQEESWTLNDKMDIDGLEEWLGNLTLELKHFDDKNSPGDSDGGEVYIFISDSAEFSYVINGSDECYILYESSWYQVDNPTYPFI